MLRKDNKIITDTKEIVQVLNDHYINIVESYLTDDIQIVDDIIRHYEDHSCVRHNKER